MLRYNSFLETLLLENIINESRIYFTPEFSSILNKLTYKSDIAKHLLGIEKEDVKPDMTFISVGDKEGDVKFTQIKKIENYIKAYYNNDDFSNDYINQIDNGNLSSEYVDKLWNNIDDIRNKSRNSTGIGRLVNQIFPGKFTSKEVEEFVNHYKNINKPDSFKFKLVKGEDIRKYYLDDNYLEENGDLGNSCMRKQSCQEYLDIYTENENIVQLLVYVDYDDKVMGRALIWKLNSKKSEKIEDAEYYMDRVYTINNSINILFTEYAKEKNWAFRTYSGHNNYNSVTFNNTSYRNVDMSIHLDKYDFEYFPYMDTFKRINDEYLYNDEDGNGWLLTETDGSYQDNEGDYSEYYGCTIPNDQSIWSEPLNTYLYSDRCVEVTLGYRYHRGYYPDNYEYVVWDPYIEEYVHEDDACYSEYLETSYFNEDDVNIITYVGEIEYWTKFRSNFNYDNVSDQWNGIINQNKMACEDYLNIISEYSDVSENIISYSNEMEAYYFTDLSVEVFDTEKGMLSIDHAKFLGVEKGKIYETDYLHYLYNNPYLNELYKTIEKEIEKTESILNGDISRIKFEDDEEYIKKLEKKLKNLRSELDIIENWI